MFRSLFGKLLLSFFLIVFFVMAVLAGFLYNFIIEYMYEQKEQELMQKGERILPIIEGVSNAEITNTAFNAFIRIVDYNKDTDIWIVDLEGNRNAYSSSSNTINHDPVDTSNQFIASVFDGNTISAVAGFHVNDNEPVISVGMPITSNGKVIGGLFLHSPIQGVQESIKKITNNIMRIFLITAIMGIVLIFLIAKRISYPLKEVAKASRSIAKGDFSHRVKSDYGDEVGVLANNFNEMADSLEKVEDQRREFVSNVSHELRSPLTIIRGYLTGLVDGTISKEEEKKYLKITLSESERMARMIEELLAISRMDAGNMELNMTVFNINELLLRCLVSKEEIIEKKNMDVNVDFDDEVCYVKADQDRITQVIVNLLDNAIKFNEEGKTLTVATFIDGDLAYVKIKDEGIGIPKEERKLIFKRFYQVDKSRSGRKRGTGLGLSIVKTIIDEHGRDIWVNSEVGQGTEFIFSLLPAKKPKQIGS